MPQTQKQKEKTASVVEKSRTAPNDTGSPEVQVSLLTSRILELTEHLRTHKKDFSSQRGLLKMVGQRRRILDYLRDASASRYLKLIQTLELRK